MRNFLLPIFFTLLLPHALRAGVVHLRYAWPGGHVPVCWGGSSDMRSISNAIFDFSHVSDEAVRVVVPEVRKHFRRLAEAQVTPPETGVHLTGWESCSSSDVETVKIMFVRPDTVESRWRPGVFIGGLASLGYRSSENLEHELRPLRGPGQHFLIVAMPDAPNEDVLQSVELLFMHEFGHVLGLRHGHLQSPTTEFQEKIGRGALFTSAHDPSSIMDYDYIEPMIGRARPLDRRLYSPVLSSGDLHSLRCLYSYNRRQRRQLCHAQRRPWEDG